MNELQQDTVVKETWWKRIITYLRTRKTRSKGFVLMISALTFCGGLVLDKGADKLLSWAFPSDVDAKIDTIRENTGQINNAVQSLNDELKALGTALPAEVMASLEARLSEISQSVADIRPAAETLASVKGEYVAGARVSEGPYEGTGVIFLNADNGKRGDSAMLCGGYTLAFEVKEKRSPSVILNGPYSRSAAFPSSAALKVETTSATFNGSFEEDGTLRVIYNCGPQ